MKPPGPAKKCHDGDEPPADDIEVDRSLSIYSRVRCGAVRRCPRDRSWGANSLRDVRPARVASVPVPERISVDVVAKVAHLARLALTPDELDRYTVQLADMLEHFADIDSLDLASVQPMTQPLPLQNVFRDDVELPPLDRDEVLASAPDAEDGRFRIPPVLGESA
jgi:aspartyl-tRNA(Asn)/glutamyl-tRNA(Gln) amidotransferase subunit C